MSWSLTVRADRPIDERDVVRVLSILSKRKVDLHTFPYRQEWGWPSSFTGLGVDVDLPVHRTLCLCGADFSAHLAQKSAVKVARGLMRLGYTVHIVKLSA